MKKITIILSVGLVLFGLQFGNAQIFKKLKKKFEKKVDEVEQKIADKVEDKVDEQVDSIQILEKKPNTKKPKTKEQSSKMPEFSNSDAKALGKYVFTYETVVEINPPDQNKTYKVSYLLNPDVEYMGIKADISDYSDADVEGESIIIFDGEQNFAFVSASGRKMQMSISQMGENNVGNPAEQLKNYDYTIKPEKTGATKTILGETCYEYVMSDDQASIQLWIAPDVDIPNWFIQNHDVLDASSSLPNNGSSGNNDDSNDDDDDINLSLEELPDPIIIYLEDNYPNDPFCEAEMEEDDDEPYKYEVKLASSLELYFRADLSLFAVEQNDEPCNGNDDDDSSSGYGDDDEFKLAGHIMAYRVESKDGVFTSETVEIKTDVNKVINTNEYKKMF